MKVAIIGGGGLVGSMAAYALQCGGIVSDICLIDANAELSRGQAIDLLHGASLAADQRITSGAMDEAASSDVVVITAGDDAKDATVTVWAKEGKAATLKVKIK